MLLHHANHANIYSTLSIVLYTHRVPKLNLGGLGDRKDQVERDYTLLLDPAEHKLTSPGSSTTVRYKKQTPVHCCFLWCMELDGLGLEVPPDPSEKNVVSQDRYGSLLQS